MGGGGRGDLLGESAIFYPYTLHGVFGKAISWSVLILFADTVATQSLGEVQRIASCKIEMQLIS